MANRTNVLREIEQYDIVIRKMFADTISDKDFLNLNLTKEVFHEILILAKDRNWIHPTKLAQLLGVSEPNVRKYFAKDPEKRVAPTDPETWRKILAEVSKHIHAEASKHILDGAAHLQKNPPSTMARAEQKARDANSRAHTPAFPTASETELVHA